MQLVAAVELHAATAVSTYVLKVGLPLATWRVHTHFEVPELQLRLRAQGMHDGSVLPRHAPQNQARRRRRVCCCQPRHCLHQQSRRALAQRTAADCGSC